MVFRLLLFGVIAAAMIAAVITYFLYCKGHKYKLKSAEIQHDHDVNDDRVNEKIDVLNDVRERMKTVKKDDKVVSTAQRDGKSKARNKKDK